MATGMYTERILYQKIPYMWYMGLVEVDGKEVAHRFYERVKLDFSNNLTVKADFHRSDRGIYVYQLHFYANKYGPVAPNIEEPVLIKKIRPVYGQPLFIGPHDALTIIYTLTTF